jgi:OmcA/MtrC family decaheme c-type cytochrome
MAGAFASPQSRGPVTVVPRGGANGSSPQAIYLPQSKEYYLTEAQSDFARPGYHIKINSVTIGADRKAVVDVKISDDLGAPLDRAGIQTPGAISLTFVLAWYNADNRNYTTYATRKQTSPITGVTATQPTSDSGGVYKDIELGHFTYTFGTAAPAGFDMTKTHTLAAYGRRTMPADIMDGKVYIDNDEFDFRPDSQPVTVKWDEIQEKNACNQCHDPLAAHGDVRQDAKLCVLCHSRRTRTPTPGTFST